MITWQTMYTIIFYSVEHAHFIFCTNYLLENRTELDCIIVPDICMYRKMTCSSSLQRKYADFFLIRQTIKVERSVEDARVRKLN